jgi:hypothetical protein
LLAQNVRQKIMPKATTPAAPRSNAPAKAGNNLPAGMKIDVRHLDDESIELRKLSDDSDASMFFVNLPDENGRQVRTCFLTHSDDPSEIISAIGRGDYYRSFDENGKLKNSFRVLWHQSGINRLLIAASQELAPAEKMSDISRDDVDAIVEEYGL